MSVSREENQKTDLVEEILCSGESVCLRLLGMSMIPTIWPGDLVIVGACLPQTLNPGEIVLYEAAGKFIVHRLSERKVGGESSLWFTKGDSMPGRDPVISQTQILGRVLYLCRKGRKISPPSRLSLIRWMLGWLACYSGTCRGILLRLHSHFASEGQDPGAPEERFALDSQ